jgi:transglutaminase-like putative cysteine protease
VTITEPDLHDIEERALDRLDAESGHVEEDLEAAAAAAAEEPLEGSPFRLAVAIALPTIGAAVMVGGVFIGASPRVFGAIAGVLGVALAAGASRIRNATTSNTVIAVGLFVVGVLAVVPTGLSNLGSLESLIRVAAKNGNVTRPPVQFSVGWHAIVAWLMGIVGFTAAWVALAVRKPSIGLLIPLPMAAVAAISVPSRVQVASGITVLVLFAAGLGIVSSARGVREEDERPPLGYEVRRAGRGIVFIALITGALIGLSQTSFLFPKRLIDPTTQPQRPRTAPLNPTDDRILFEASPPTGPFRTGSLDVFDGTYWRLPPLADSKLKNVPTSGIVDASLPTGTSATITIRGLSGAVLPTLPNTVGIVGRGNLSYDGRSNTIRESQGSVAGGFTYQVAAAPLPKATDLEADTDPIPVQFEQFTQAPPPPPAAVDLINQAHAKATNKWDQYLYLFDQVRSIVTASGEGVATAVPPTRIQDMLAGAKEGSPFEIVAAEALLARWDGIPARIAYGYDIVHGDHIVNGAFQAHPNDGATFVEVYFPRYEWLPLTAPPKRAKPTVGSAPSNQQVNPQVVPSDDIGVPLYLPVVTQPASVFGKQLLAIIGVVVPIILLLLLLYYLYPALAKARLRAKRRAAARAAGPRARIALAYAEWRDFAADFGYQHPGDTPLQFLSRFVDDDEHSELAWLVTRSLWGDLAPNAGLALSAEELSRALRRRLAQAHPGTLRFVAALSRISVRHPYAAPFISVKEPELVAAP